MNLIALFKQLTSIDSVSGEEKEVSDFIMEFLTDLGLEPSQDENYMIYCRIGNQPNPTLFCAHMDTVEPGRNIEVQQRDDFLVSNGTTILGGDNKISLTAILFSVQELMQNNRQPNIELVFSVREETNSGIREFDTNLIQSKRGFVFDGGREDLGWCVQSSPSIYDFEIEITGKSAHTSKPEEGINVLETLRELLNELKLGRPDEFSTFNIGLINGGDATNTIPGNLTLKGDIRSTRVENFERHKAHVDEVINNIGNQGKASIEFKWIPYSDGYELDLNNKFFEQVSDIYNSLGITINPTETKGGSDANFLNAKGIYTLCLGDGVLDPHTVNERIKISDFEKLNQIILKLMSSKYD